MTVAELLARIDSREVSAWQAYERVHGPLGPLRGDYQAAVVAATVANALAGKKSRRRKLADFLIEWDRRPQSWEEQLAAVRTMNRAMGGRDLTRGGGRGDADQSAGADQRQHGRAGRRTRRGAGPAGASR